MQHSLASKTGVWCTPHSTTHTHRVRASTHRKLCVSLGLVVLATVMLAAGHRAISPRAVGKAAGRSLVASRQPSVRAMGLFSFLTGSNKPGCELAPKEAPPGLKLATVAGGCFWGLELAYQRQPGVVSAYSGYTGGHKANPTYEAVCSGSTGHTEAIRVTYDPKEVTYDELLDVFFDKVDPTTLNRQGYDAGTQYRSGIYYHDEAQKAAAEAKIQAVNEKLQKGQKPRPFSNKPYEGKRIVSELLPAGDFYIAEEYHQQYLSKGGRFGMAQSAEKGCKDEIRCYG